MIETRKHSNRVLNKYQDDWSADACISRWTVNSVSFWIILIWIDRFIYFSMYKSELIKATTNHDWYWNGIILNSMLSDTYCDLLKFHQVESWHISISGLVRITISCSCKSTSKHIVLKRVTSYKSLKTMQSTRILNHLKCYDLSQILWVVANFQARFSNISNIINHENYFEWWT